MYPTKQPTLRISQADFKCKNGCGFYGNPEWEGYCSKCYPEYMQKLREKNISKEKAEHSKAGFSKFEEKKRQQTDKKNKYLKNLTVFRKSSNAKDAGKSEVHRDIRHTNPEVEKLTAEYITKYGSWGDNVRKDFLKCVDAVYKKVLSEVDNKPIEDTAELIQKYYKMFSKRLNSTLYVEVNQDVKDQMLDFFEKFVMTGLYSVLFCPHTTNDEEEDLTIQDRIRKLSWVTAHHLGCCISETSMEVRDLVYTAITDLLGVDSVKAPQDKLACVVRCCSSIMLVLQHCQGAPVSADEFLPALIFIVLKGNPARLKSNIHYVTRFCNDSRLMQGEEGYYFTNLCCAVSFVENLTAESLNMTEEEFNAYMTGIIAPVSAWESALVACESMHQLCEHVAQLKSLSGRIEVAEKGAVELRGNINNFKDEFKKKVSSVLMKTPLILKPRKRAINFSLNAPVISLPLPTIKATPIDEIETSDLFLFDNKPKSDVQQLNFYEQNLQLHTMDLITNKQKSDLQLSITPCVDLAFDNQSLTFDEQHSSFLELSNVNYDIDFSDLSADNSVAEELTPEKHKSPSFTPDPFSPIGTSYNISQAPLLPSSVPLIPSTSKVTDDPFSMADPVVETILDQTENSTANLPTPLKPTTSQYLGFSKQGCQIPSIPCNTGDFNLLDSLQPQVGTTNSDLSFMDPFKSFQNNNDVEKKS